MLLLDEMSGEMAERKDQALGGGKRGVTKKAAKVEKVGKQTLLEEVAAKSGEDIETVINVYEALTEQIIEHARGGREVMLTGFGRFYPWLHKGHRVQFGDSDSQIPDYMVFKFSAARNVNRSL